MRRLLFCLVTGCKPAMSPPAPPAAPPAPAPKVEASAPTAAAPPTLSGPVTLTVKQRSQTPITGFPEGTVLSIGDITRGKVEASIRNEMEAFLQPGFMESGDRRTFELLDGKYDLALTKLDNALVGEDFATFTVSEAAIEATSKAAAGAPAGATPTAALTEAQKIDQLITHVESLSGAVFIRNGEEHSPAEAAKHLRQKLGTAEAGGMTAREFIDQIASRSSLSGNEYEIRFADGRIVKAGEYLNGELKTIEGEKK